MIYLNTLLVVATALVCLAGWFQLQGQSATADRQSMPEEFLKRYEWIWFALILILGASIRLIHFPGIPAGFNQDEASIAIDAIALMEHGTDRFGYAYPVYTVAWGAGHAPFLTYFTIPFMKIFGTGPLGFRLCNNLLSIASIACMYFLFRKTHSRRMGLIAMGVLATAPWNILLARWSLDANPLPSLAIIATCAFFYVLESRKLWLYAASGLLFALTLYAYGTAFVVIPLFLVLTVLYLWRKKSLTTTKSLSLMAGFVVGSLPIASFLAVNFLKLPEIRTSFFSIPRLTAMRSASVFRTMENGWSDIVDSIKASCDIILWQNTDYIWNNIAAFGNTYWFSTPLIVFGALVLLRQLRQSRNSHHATVVFAIFAGSTFLLMLLLYQNVNRAGIVFVPVIVLIALAIDFLITRVRFAAIVIGTAYALSFANFSVFYLQNYNALIGASFFDSFGEAVQYATHQTKGTIYVTERGVNGSWVLTQYYAHTNPEVFARTVEFHDNRVEFRSAKHFDRFIFTVPESFPTNAVGIIHNSDLNRFSPDRYFLKTFQYYSVVVPKELAAAHLDTATALYLSSLSPLNQQQSWGSPRMNASQDGNPLRIGTQTFYSGIGTHASSSIRYTIPPQACMLEFFAGIDSEVGKQGKVQFRVLLDNQPVWQSGIKKGLQEADFAQIPIRKQAVLELQVDSLDNLDYDHADWANIRFLTTDCAHTPQ